MRTSAPAPEPRSRTVSPGGSEARVFELEETLAATREELGAVREINRELLSQHNRPTD